MDLRTPQMRRQEQEERLSEQRIAPRVRPLTPVRRVQSTQTRTFGEPELPELYQRRMTSAPVLRNPGAQLALRAGAGQVRDVRHVFVTDYGYDPGNPQTWEQAYRQAIAEAQRRTAQGVEGVRVRYPGDEETFAEGVGGTLGQLRDIDAAMAREISSPLTGATPANPIGSEGTLLGGEDRSPGVRIARGFVEEAARPTSIAAMLVPLAKGPLAARLIQNAVMQGGTNVALDLLLGRTDPKQLALSAGLGATLGAGLPEVGTSIKAIREFGATPEGKALAEKLQSESGALRMARGPEDLGGAAGEAADPLIRSAQTLETPPPEALVGADAALRAETGIPASEAASRLPGQPPAVGGGPPEPPKPPVAEGPVPQPERLRVSKLIAGGVERQGPEFAQQEAIRSQERAQRFARVREIRRDMSLTPEERNAAWRSAMAGEYRKGEYTPLEISDADYDIAEGMIRDSDLREGEWIGSMVGLARLRSGQHLREFEQELMGRVFGPEVLKAIKARNQSLAANIARTWGVSAEDVTRAARAEELARPTGKVAASALDTGEQVAARKISSLTREAREGAIKRQLRRQAQSEARELREINAEVARSTRQMVRETEKYLKTTPEGLAKRAAQMVPENQAPVVAEAVRYWSEGNRAIIDGVGETQGAGKLARVIQTALSGEVTDSYVARLASRQAFLEMALLHEGIEPKSVGKIGQMMFDREIKLRYGNNIPKGVSASIGQLKGLQLHGSTTGTILEALASLSEETKNLMFGLDLGVFGLQARAAVQGGGIPGLAGAINRTLTKMHAPHFGDLYLDTTLDRQTANMLDGLYYGRGPAAVTERGVVMSVPGYGQVVDKLTDFQFKTILGGMRDTIYEGNLLLLHLLGRNIKNPATRARAAEWANMLTGWSNLAQTARRQRVERAFLVSPAMTRAQFGELISAGKLLSPKADADQRILAALAIASYGVSWLAVGKLINDAFGIKDFEMDPTKPGAGTITLKVPGMGETSVPFMANASLKRTFLQSLRLLAEGDEEGLTNAWLRYATARQAVSGRGITGLTTGRGYTTEGKFTPDISREELMKSLIPVPPALQSQLTQGFNPVRAGLESLGVNNYPRSVFDKADETLREYNGDFKAAAVATEGPERDIIEYRWRQDLEKRLPEGVVIVPGEFNEDTGRGFAPSLAYPGIETKLLADPYWFPAFWDELNIDVTGLKTISEIRRFYVDQKTQALMERDGVTEAVARDQLGAWFDQSEVVAGHVLRRKKDGSVAEREKDGYKDFIDLHKDALWEQYPDLAQEAEDLGLR